MLYIREAKGTVAEVTSKIEDAAKANYFGVMEIINLKQKMVDKGVEFDPECMIVEVCNPVQAKKVLMADMSISTALPCRISVYEEDGVVKVATLKPTAILALFGNPNILHVAEFVETTIQRIIDTACE